MCEGSVGKARKKVTEECAHITQQTALRASLSPLTGENGALERAGAVQHAAHAASDRKGDGADAEAGAQRVDLDRRHRRLQAVRAAGARVEVEVAYFLFLFVCCQVRVGFASV